MSPRPHRRLNRRHFLSATGAAGMLTGLSACGLGADNTSNGGSWSFTDDRGETIELDGEPSNIVAFIGTAAALYDFGVEDFAAVFGPTVNDDGTPDIQAGDLPVDGLPVIGHAWGEFDVEAYAQVNPSILISGMFTEPELWYVPAEVMDQVTDVAPTVALDYMESTMEEIIERHYELAQALRPDADFSHVDDHKQQFEEAVEALQAANAEKNLTVMACAPSNDVLYVNSPLALPDLRFFAEHGTDIVIPDGVPDGDYNEQVSWENADLYDCDILMIDNRQFALSPDQLIEEFPTWAQLPAVQAGQIISWDPEPRNSYAGFQPSIEALTEGLLQAQKVT